MFYTIYKITNQIDGKFYIGSHKTKNLNDNYMGSGKYLKHAQEKYGIDNFVKEILFVFDTADEMYMKEAEIVNEDFLATENTYNLKIGGFGGFDFINNDVENRKLKNRKAILAAKSKMNEKYGVEHSSQIKHVREALSTAMKKRYANGSIFWKPPKFTNKKHTDETKKKISEKTKISSSGNRNSQYGTMWITDGLVSKKIKKTDVIPDGWHRGRKKAR